MKRTEAAGFTLWELMVVIALIIILILAAIENLLPLLGDAERAAHASTRGALQSTIGLESTERALNGGLVELEKMNGGNPVDWLHTPMNNYIGEVSGASYAAIPPRHWAFDTEEHVLVYRVGFPEYFTGDFMNPAAIRYRVVADRTGVHLQQIDAGEWTTDGSVLARLAEDPHE